MTEQARAEPQEHWIIDLLSGVGYLLEFASIFVQIMLVAQAINLDRLPPGEGRAFAGLGSAMMIYASFFLVIPVALLAFARAGVALGRFRARSRLLPLVIHAAVALSPFVSYPLVLHERPAKPRAEPPAITKEQGPDPSEWIAAQGGTRMSGVIWAMNNGITREEDCRRGRPPRAFVEGCSERARYNPR